MKKIVIAIEIAKTKTEATEKARETLKNLQEHFVFGGFTIFEGMMSSDWGRFPDTPYVFTAADKKKLTMEEWKDAPALDKKTTPFNLLHTLFKWQLQEREKSLAQIVQGVMIRDVATLLDEGDYDLRQAFLAASGHAKFAHVFHDGKVVHTKRELLDLMTVPKGEKVFLVPAIVE